MGKLHEVLAVEGSRRGAFDKVLAETMNIFKERTGLFSAFERRYEPFSEEDANERGVVERQSMTTTVPKRLSYLGGFLEQYIDTVYQKEATNTQALGSLNLGNGTEIGGLPVAFLLNLESTLARVRDVLHETPTHAAGIKWVEDDTHEFKPDVVRSEEPEMAFRTKKIIKPFELAPATKEHKAQVEKLTEDKPVGKLLRDIWSGMISPADKSALLSRIDKMIENVRVARMRANETEAISDKIGAQIVQSLLKG